MKFRKIIICIILFCMLFQTFSYAADLEPVTISQEQFSNLFFSPSTFTISPLGGTAMDIMTKIVTMQFYIMLNLPTVVTIATNDNIGGNISKSAANISDAVTIEGLCFSNYSIFDINFFDYDSNTTGVISLIKKNISVWYNNLRNVSTAALLCVLLYIGIKMALSTTR